MGALVIFGLSWESVILLCVLPGFVIAAMVVYCWKSRDDSEENPQTSVPAADTGVSGFPGYTIIRKWPPKHSDRIQLYSFPTPNGIKVSVMLEETGLVYEPHRVDLENDDQLSPEFLSLNPNNKIPALLDPSGPDGAPLELFESGAILLYLAEKTGRFIPLEARGRYETIQWLFFQMSEMGPMFGQVGFFNKFAGHEYEDNRPLQRFVGESKRLLGVLDRRLEQREWIMGDLYTIADMSVFPWVRTLITSYGAAGLVGIGDFPNVVRTMELFQSRPAVIRGNNIPARDPG